jgi:hypothetical protein
MVCDHYARARSAQDGTGSGVFRHQKKQGRPFGTTPGPGYGGGERDMSATPTQCLEHFVYFALFRACTPLANWLISHVGTVCPPDSPCLIPVWPGIQAPSGVLAVSMVLVLRNLVQRRLGLSWTLMAIGVGTLAVGRLGSDQVRRSLGGRTQHRVSEI